MSAPAAFEVSARAEPPAPARVQSVLSDQADPQAAPVLVHVSGVSGAGIEVKFQYLMRRGQLSSEDGGTVRCPLLLCQISMRSPAPMSPQGSTQQWGDQHGIAILLHKTQLITLTTFYRLLVLPLPRQAAWLTVAQVVRDTGCDFAPPFLKMA